ncbi:MAG: hypothetical protein Q9226_002909 [Calogaya cf. arnoldii]
MASLSVRALYNGTALPANPADLPTGPPSPAAHFFYFFENKANVAAFVANVFKNLTACSDFHDCGHHTVRCDVDGNPARPQCSSPPGRYGYVSLPNQYSGPQSYVNGVVYKKGGGIVWSCPAGRYVGEGAGLGKVRQPCTASVPGKDNIGSAMLAQLVQIDMITNIDIPFLESKTGSQNITVQVLDGQRAPPINERAAQGMTLLDLGFGVNGGGLRERGLANAQNYVEFAKWSWDLGYGLDLGPNYGGDVSTEKCDELFQEEIETTGAKPISG